MKALELFPKSRQLYFRAAFTIEIGNPAEVQLYAQFSRKWRRQELVQHFSEQCRHYLSKQNITFKHWGKVKLRRG